MVKGYLVHAGEVFSHVYDGRSVFITVGDEMVLCTAQ